ncbi:hypothetical protein ACIBQX_48455 [Nonomuraea sp. NPDC049714]|uniref:hypothetical protein n=1 Tax=Nonomuraea sp. NPDC049714 TaxID=3364357 RepID=UPI00378A5739
MTPMHWTLSAPITDLRERTNRLPLSSFSSTTVGVPSMRMSKPFIAASLPVVEESAEDKEQ